MRPAYRTGGPRFFIRWSAATGLAAAIVVGSVLTVLLPGGLGGLLPLTPVQVWSGGAWWQIVSYSVVAVGPFNVLGAVRQQGSLLVSSNVAEWHVEPSPRGDIASRA